MHGLPLFHVHGLVLGVLGALRVGEPCCIHTGRPTPAAYAAAAAEGRQPVLRGADGVVRLAAERRAAAALRPARLLVSGSAGLPVPVFERLVAGTGQGPVERYGMTETLHHRERPRRDARRAGWVGRPLHGCRDPAGRRARPRRWPATARRWGSSKCAARP